MSAFLRVLVADDDRDFLDAMSALLALLGASEVTTARNGLDALESLAEEPGAYDLVITDVRMPPPSGVQLVAMARTAGCDTPFVVVTGYPDSRVTDTLDQLDGVTLLLKPIEASELLAVVSRLLHDSSARWPGRRKGMEEGRAEL